MAILEHSAGLPNEGNSLAELAVSSGQLVVLSVGKLAVFPAGGKFSKTLRAQLLLLAGCSIPVNRVSNGKGGWADLIIIQAQQATPLSHHCTAELSSLVKTNTWGNRNGGGRYC